MNEYQEDLEVPICVDLEGALIRNDVAAESLILLILRRPWYLPLVCLWLLRGTKYLRSEVARRVTVDCATFPYQKDLVSYLRTQHEQGRSIILTTATDRVYGEQIATHLGLFQEVVAGEGPVRFTGSTRADALVQRFGRGRFDYAGHHKHDLPVWAAARSALVVDGSNSLRSELAECVKVLATFDSIQPHRGWAYFRAVRPHQWLKNLLIFVPALAAHRFLEQTVWVPAVLAFATFCFAASAGYILNDLLDLPSDRRHARKCKRPFASGAASASGGMILGLTLLALSLVTGHFLPPIFVLCLLLYLVGTISYSTWLKRKAVVDVLTLAALYTLRILAGSAATQILPSFWLLALSMFFFMDLACVKRYVELHGRPNDNTRIPGRGYGSVDRETLFAIGTNSGLMSVLVLALYINASGITSLYPNPEFLWGLCPLLMYWTSRIWILARRGELHDDPLVFAVRDRISLIMFTVLAALLALGSIRHLRLAALLS